ncbi:hypothetical protein Dform_00423 [Dehalogenimonas formicexedens]|uniref:Uncharacterized protein n=1 Tax=Dehalogenimonas formicexedens TaxID=1839801 RepID=A0A1P8F5M5_9CHLR|nr:hypothetical protein [Dehalogenimonas formicexedens]APV43781.1 hypothetical protein Dform_00423 [Dehalogenimonas formicexedens]
MFELAHTSSPWDWCYSSRAISESPVNGMNQSELIRLLDSTILSWNAREIRPSHIYSIIDLVNQRIKALKITWLNRESLPICYFSSLQTIGALMTKAYLETHNIATSFQGISSEDDLKLLINKWKIEQPRAIIFSFSSFQYINLVQTYVPQLRSLTNKAFAGGLIFSLDKSLMKHFPGFYFPPDLPSLIESIVKEDK